jgi:hypothetical protein
MVEAAPIPAIPGTSVTFSGEGTTLRRSGARRVPLPAESQWLREHGRGAAPARPTTPP